MFDVRLLLEPLVVLWIRTTRIISFFHEEITSIMRKKSDNIVIKIDTFQNNLLLQTMRLHFADAFITIDMPNCYVFINSQLITIYGTYK